MRLWQAFSIQRAMALQTGSGKVLQRPWDGAAQANVMQVENKGTSLPSFIPMVLDMSSVGFKKEGLVWNLGLTPTHSGRKGRNIWNHLFVIYGVINDVKIRKAGDFDIHGKDINKCFDDEDYSDSD